MFRNGITTGRGFRDENSGWCRVMIEPTGNGIGNGFREAIRFSVKCHDASHGQKRLCRAFRERFRSAVNRGEAPNAWLRIKRLQQARNQPRRIINGEEETPDDKQ